ncbi:MULTISPECIES: hypothetical protein [Rhodococcus]|uniref:Uncharacterized protein n=1 Tax=Rhodococcus pyridinivorans AK37 TaxID=1114960 RepID=H0JXC2_9NOCA|nr:MULTISPECIES: hypothetical protein [Rhodococcus]AWZ24337.1 hypothetical protein CEJ39_09195 [Rhodococcus pyridinivorans]EHK80950.1 hypothetical protein AK37_21996 [Rhodococcus pyridinivorans AK37]MBX4167836.1 hypothetical protein [Rhodococcus sp. DMU2021]MCD2116593.1 hypothetical protein [Rhodococcus pyridinivorans]MCD2141228.1 hypothetical protein [Rhodococcus pyridinivorans]
MPDLDSVADALYGLDPGDFVAARSEFAAQAREAGDRELTAAIGRLRKPTVAAWMVNLLARERADELAALLDIGSALRTAQRRLSGSEMRKLSEQRRRVVAALERDAGRLAADRGRTVSESALREVGRTLNAALSDPDIGEQVRQGRLDAIVESDGFGDLSAMPLTVVRGGSEEDDEDDRTAAGKSARKSKGEREPTEREKADQAAREAEIDEAAAALDSAHNAAEEAREAASAAEQELARHEEEVAELRAKLEHAEQQRTFARRAAAEAKKRVVAAERAVSAAEVDLARTKN